MSGLALAQLAQLNAPQLDERTPTADVPVATSTTELPWESYEEVGHRMGEAVRQRLISATASTAKGVAQTAIVLPVQTVGRTGKTATNLTLARALPSLMKRAVPLLHKRLEPVSYTHLTLPTICSV